MKIKLTILGLFLNLLLLSQVKFTVYKTTGNVQYFADKTKNWLTLKAKDTISNETKIKCLSNSTFIIFDSDYRIYELKQQGEYLLKNTLHTSENTTSREMQKAIRYFVEQTFAAGTENNKQKVKGAVYRGEESVFPWDGTVILNDSFDLEIDLSKTSYPVKITLNKYSVLIYHDTTIRIPSNYLIDNQMNILNIGAKKQIHLSKEIKNREMMLSYIATLTSENKKPEALNYALVIMHCINSDYFDSARQVIEKAKMNKQLFDDVKELLKDNATAILLMK